MERKRESVVALHIAGRRPCDIVRELSALGIKKRFVLRTIKRFRETGSMAKRYGGGSRRTATSQKIIESDRHRLRRNPRRSGRQLARELGVSHRSVQRILKDHLKVQAYKLQKVQGLTMPQKKTRLQRAKLLKTMCDRGELPNIVFIDGKVFTIQQSKMTGCTFEADRHRMQSVCGSREPKPRPL